MKGTLVCAYENLRNEFQFDDEKFDEDEHTLADEIGIVDVDARWQRMFGNHLNPLKFTFIRIQIDDDYQLELDTQ